MNLCTYPYTRDGMYEQYLDYAIRKTSVYRRDVRCLVEAMCHFFSFRRARMTRRDEVKPSESCKTSVLRK